MPPTEAAELLGVPNVVQLSVADDGHGMSPDVARRATEAFFTTKDPSNGAKGLGLFVAVSFAEQAQQRGSRGGEGRQTDRTG